MSQISIQKCDICGRIKGESNHWLKALPYANTYTYMQPMEELNNPWLDICSPACATKALNDWITSTQESGPCDKDSK